MNLDQPTNPPPYVFVDFDEWGTPKFAWPLETPGTVRYVFAPEGSAEVIVLDRQVAEQWMRSKSSYVANSELADAIGQALRAARGGAS